MQHATAPPSLEIILVHYPCEEMVREVMRKVPCHGVGGLEVLQACATVLAGAVAGGCCACWRGRRGLLCSELRLLLSCCYSLLFAPLLGCKPSTRTSVRYFAFILALGMEQQRRPRWSQWLSPVPRSSSAVGHGSHGSGRSFCAHSLSVTRQASSAFVMRVWSMSIPMNTSSWRRSPCGS